MKLFLFGLDAVGFMGVSIFAATVAAISSLLRLILNVIRIWKKKALQRFRRIKLPTLVSMTRTTKIGSDWIVIRAWKFSFLLGVKGD